MTPRHAPRFLVGSAALALPSSGCCIAYAATTVHDLSVGKGKASLYAGTRLQ